MPRCSYLDCKNDSRYKHCWGNEKISFIPIPKPSINRYLCEKWMNLCGLTDVSKISRNTYICSKHFVGGCGPTPVFPDPFCYKTNTAQKIDIDNVINEETVVTLESSEDDSDGNDLKLLSESDSEPEIEHNYAKTPLQTSEPNLQTTRASSCARNLFNVSIKKRKRTPDCFLKDHKYFSYDTLSLRADEFEFFTGLCHQHFIALYNFLDPAVMGSLKYNYHKRTPKKSKVRNAISDKEKLCITLIRIRRGFTLKELAYFFGISASWVAAIVYTWIQFIFLKTVSCRSMLFQSSRTIPRNQIPKCFRAFPGLTLVLDATEVSIQIPKNYRQQGNTHSAYKHDNTVKFLVGINANGLICYVSEGFEGSISDRQLFTDCDLQHFLKENDVLLADRGFNISDIADEIRVKLYIPPFLTGRQTFTAEEEVVSKQIAKGRIHIERAIGRIKKFRILTRRIPMLLLPILSATFYVISFLANFKSRLI